MIMSMMIRKVVLGKIIAFEVKKGTCMQRSRGETGTLALLVLLGTGLLSY